MLRSLAHLCGRSLLQSNPRNALIEFSKLPSSWMYSSTSASFSAESGVAAEANPASSSSGGKTVDMPSRGPSTPAIVSSDVTSEEQGQPQQQQSQPGLFGPRKVARLFGGRQAQEGRSKEGIIHLNNTKNNMIITLTDLDGKVKGFTTAGTVGFKNARKSLPVAAERAGEEIAKKARKMGISSAIVKIKGLGPNRHFAVQSIHATGINITKIMDVTPTVYNGCRPPKKRRV